MLAWHYTTGEKFKQIVESGVLMPSSLGIATDEKAVLWFSFEQFWEPTAQKAVMQQGEVILQGMRGTFERGGGSVRLGVSEARLVAWPRLAKLANMRASMRRALERTARTQSAVPEHWCGLVGEGLALADIEVVEVFDGERWSRKSSRLHDSSLSTTQV